MQWAQTARRLQIVFIICQIALLGMLYDQLGVWAIPILVLHGVALYISVVRSENEYDVRLDLKSLAKPKDGVLWALRDFCAVVCAVGLALLANAVLVHFMGGGVFYALYNGRVDQRLVYILYNIAAFVQTVVAIANLAAEIYNVVRERSEQLSRVCSVCRARPIGNHG